MKRLAKKILATGTLVAAFAGSAAFGNSCKVTQNQGYTRATPSAANSLVLSRSPEANAQSRRGLVETEIYNDTENGDVYTLHFEKPPTGQVQVSCTGLRYDLEGKALYTPENTYPIRVVDDAGVLSKIFTLGIRTNPKVVSACHRNVAYDCVEVDSGSDSYLCAPKGNAATAITPS